MNLKHNHRAVRSEVLLLKRNGSMYLWPFASSTATLASRASYAGRNSETEPVRMRPALGHRRLFPTEAAIQKIGSDRDDVFLTRIGARDRL